MQPLVHIFVTYLLHYYSNLNPLRNMTRGFEFELIQLLCAICNIIEKHSASAYSNKSVPIFVRLPTIIRGKNCCTGPPGIEPGSPSGQEGMLTATP